MNTRWIYVETPNAYGRYCLCAKYNGNPDELASELTAKGYHFTREDAALSTLFRVLLAPPRRR